MMGETRVIASLMTVEMSAYPLCVLVRLMDSAVKVGSITPRFERSYALILGRKTSRSDIINFLEGNNE